MIKLSLITAAVLGTFCFTPHFVLANEAKSKGNGSAADAPIDIENGHKLSCSFKIDATDNVKRTIVISEISLNNSKAIYQYEDSDGQKEEYNIRITKVNEDSDEGLKKGDLVFGSEKGGTYLIWNPNNAKSAKVAGEFMDSLEEAFLATCEIK